MRTHSSRGVPLQIERSDFWQQRPVLANAAMNLYFRETMPPGAVAYLGFGIQGSSALRVQAKDRQGEAGHVQGRHEAPHIHPCHLHLCMKIMMTTLLQIPWDVRQHPWGCTSLLTCHQIQETSLVKDER